MFIKALKDYKAGDVRHKLLNFNQTEVKADTSNEVDIAGEISGFAAGLLNIDRGQDIIFPGAFKNSLSSFMDSGVVCWQHDWSSPIGKPFLAEEKGEPDYALFTRAKITATTLGTDVMKLVKTNVIKRLSIGYRLTEGGYSVMNRETLEATLKERSINPVKTAEILSDFDRRKLSEVFGLFDIELFEYSPVTRPMNENAAITGAKAENGLELLDGLPFSFQPLIVLGAVKGYAARVKESFDIYSNRERSISQPHKDGVKQIREELETLLPQLKELESLVSSEKASPDEIAKVLGAVAYNEAILAGHLNN